MAPEYLGESLGGILTTLARHAVMNTGDVTYEQLMAAVKKHKVSIPSDEQNFFLAVKLHVSVVMLASFRIRRPGLRTPSQI